jgi:hypothetical protein
MPPIDEIHTVNIFGDIILSLDTYMYRQRFGNISTIDFLLVGRYVMFLVGHAQYRRYAVVAWSGLYGR